MVPQSRGWLGEIVKTAPWAAWSRRSKGKQTGGRYPCRDAAVVAIKEQQHTSERVGKISLRNSKKKARRNGDLDWREEDVLGASLNSSNPGNYQVQLFSLPCAVS